MKIAKALCFLMFFGSSAIAAYAQTPVDPLVVFEKDPLVPLPIVIGTFVISSKTGDSPGTSPCVLTQGGLPPNSSSACAFTDDINIDGTGFGITQLEFDIGVNPSTVNCMSIFIADFASCSVTSNGSGGTDVTFFGGTGITYGTSFGLAFNGFPANTDFNASTELVSPEPSSLILMLTGAVLLFVGQIRRRTGKRQPVVA